MTTPAQRWAQERNFSKRRLMGVRASLRNLIRSPILTQVEQSNLAATIPFIDMVIEEWDNKNFISKKYNCNT